MARGHSRPLPLDSAPEAAALSLSFFPFGLAHEAEIQRRTEGHKHNKPEKKRENAKHTR